MARRNRQSEQDVGETNQQIGDNGAGQSTGTQGTESRNRGTEETEQGTEGRFEAMAGEGEGTTQDEFGGIDPATAAGPEEPKKRRGRKPGSKNKPKGASAHLGITPEQLANQVSFIHGGLAMMTGLPFMALSPDEALQLSKSLIAMAETYNIDLFGGKTAVLIQFGATVAMIYVPRFLMLRQMRAQMRAQEEREAQADPHLTDPPPHANGTGVRGAFDLSAANG